MLYRNLITPLIMSYEQHKSSISLNQLICMVYSFDCKRDKKLIRNNQDPNLLRTKLFSLVSKDRATTKEYTSTSIPLKCGQDNDITYDYSANHYVGGTLLEYGTFPNFEPEIPFTEGITLKYSFDSEYLIFINYNKDVILGEKNGVEVKGLFSIVVTYTENSNCICQDNWGWSDPIYYSNMLQLFNKAPSIIGDICEHDEIGPQKLLDFLKIN